ncbi:MULTISPECIES: transcriptional regulator SplA domain-containing protein [unclassified Bacillus (in: firmicutes)]|uniref:transcriptional regulator SplA domain-containing protein n=1 Tax=unclassified Bacillus (in: firmicutes) TaxID=185979 RepID=UPI0008EC90E5|nr:MULTISPECIES: transcriptional regulator SplA domain-containing protein [unclassified Bacillus (in: firmicutes)]SFA91207.1 transcriptional regulator of the spore photoproduct lyase operon [Bacillus sp. UNCCL13]SFQ85535.1 transcriptional regulator [Bacillus sp. cl95]
MNSLDMNEVKLGDEVYVIYRNPHVPSVSNIRAAEIVQHPKDPQALALFINDTFHVIEDDDALFRTEQEAQFAQENLD